MSMDVREIDTLSIAPSKMNPRRIKEIDLALSELADSMREVGQLQPGIVRAIGDGYELLSGSRRWHAARLAGIEVYHAVVVDVDDHEALEMMITENMQREDLSPLEEAGAVNALILDGHTIAEVAGKLGKTPRWIARRLRLLNLVDGIQALAADPDNCVSLWTVAMLEDVARLPAETQEGLFDDIRTNCWIHTHALLLDKLASYERQLHKAPWNVDDETLCPDAGSCTNCCQRTAAQPFLFDDAGKESGDRCMSPVCWNAKLDAFAGQKELVLKDKFPYFVRVCGPYSRDDEICRKGDQGALSVREYKVVKKSTPWAVPALVVTGKGFGKQIWITTGSKQAKAAPCDLSHEDQLEAKMAVLRKRRAALTVKLFIAAVEKTDEEQISSYMLLCAAAFVGTGLVIPSWEMSKALVRWKEHSYPGCPKFVDNKVWFLVSGNITNLLQVRPGDDVFEKLEQAQSVASLLNMDDKIASACAAAEEQIPESKVIAKLRTQIDKEESRHEG